MPGERPTDQYPEPVETPITDPLSIGGNADQQSQSFLVLSAWRLLPKLFLLIHR